MRRQLPASRAAAALCASRNARGRCTIVLMGALLAGALMAVPAQALPEGRVYEMVSPPYKAGYGTAELEAVSPDGERVAFTSQGAFAGALSNDAFGNSYVARRGAAGWSTISVAPPSGGTTELSAATTDFSVGLDYALANGLLAPNTGAGEHSSTESVLELHPIDAPETAAGWETFGGIVMESLVGPAGGAFEQGASADLCDVTMYHAPAFLLQGVGSVQIYEVARGCHGEPAALRVVGLNNRNPAAVIGGPGSCTELGSGVAVDQESTRGAISADGSEIFFTSGTTGHPGCFAGHQLFVRLGGSRTVEVSRPLETGREFGGCLANGVPGEVPCAGAATRANGDFKGASDDGTHVFFTSKAALTGDVEDASSNLYMATIGCPSGEPGCPASAREVSSLTQVSHDPAAGQAAEVQGVLSISHDGSHVYFVAQGVLAPGPNPEGRTPLRGADNLYVYQTGPAGSSGKLAFVGDLCSGSGLSGVTADQHCPSDLNLKKGDEESRQDAGLWGVSPYAQTNGCPQAAAGCEPGRFLVFSTYAQLLRNDTDDAADVYRYDATTGILERVSTGEGGAGANGNEDDTTLVETTSRGGFAPNADARIRPGSIGGGDQVFAKSEAGARAISEDGSRIVFTTAGRLSPHAINARENVYEWQQQSGSSEGRVSIISTGSSSSPDAYPAISPSGRDVFFMTSAGLGSQDTDGQPDVYDARLEGGFAPAAAERERCEGDVCQGAGAPATPLLVPGSVSQAPGENLAPTAPAPPAKPNARSLTRREKLADALKSCHKKRSRQLRTSCEKAARTHYGQRRQRSR
jgi:hypothetical protein